MYSKLVLTLLYFIGLLQGAIAANETNRGGFGGRRGRALSVIGAGNGTASASATVQASVAGSASSVVASTTESAHPLGTNDTSAAAASTTTVATSSAAAGTGTGAGTANRTLDAANIQTGSQSAGNVAAEKAQAASAT